MQVTVRLFARQRELAGWRLRTFELPEQATVAQAWERLVDELPVLGPGRDSVRFARNTNYVDADERLADGDELAIIPPVAGGDAGAGGSAGAAGKPEAVASAGAAAGSAGLRRLELRAQSFDEALLAELRATVPSSADGALVLFVGQTRESPGTPAPGEEDEGARFTGRSVEGLEYEAYEAMALPVLAQIAREIAERFGVTRLAILHRTGSVPLGDVSVIIAAAAAHREAAFDACRYAIEELKARAPIWKSERFADGAMWVGAPARHGPLLAAPPVTDEA
jgi:molybdopterin synthase catalytic subunit